MHLGVIFRPVILSVQVLHILCFISKAVRRYVENDKEVRSAKALEALTLGDEGGSDQPWHQGLTQRLVVNEVVPQGRGDEAEELSSLSGLSLGVASSSIGGAAGGGTVPQVVDVGSSLAEADWLDIDDKDVSSYSKP